MRLAGEGKIIHQEIIMEEQRPRPRTPAPEEMRRNARHALEANSPIRAGPSRYHTRVDSHQAGPSTSQHHSKDFHTRSSRTAPAPPESIVSPAPGMPATPRNGVSTKRLSWADTTLPPRRKRWYETPNKPASFSFKMLPRSRMMTNPSNSGSVPVSSRVGSNSTSVGSATRGEGAGIASDFPLDEHALGKVIASLVSLLPDVPEKDSGKPVSYAIVPRKESGCWVATAHKKDALSERTQVDGRTQFKISLR